MEIFMVILFFIIGFGSNSEGQLGLGEKNEITLITKIDFKYKVKQISLGEEHTLILTNEHELYVMGSNKHGQLGTRESGGNVFIPKKIEYLKFNNTFIKKISCGYFNSFVLMNNSNIYSTGNNDVIKISFIILVWAVGQWKKY
jgi:alpha-tubulin suppressor-like RCC1 family protein